jgi:hypothetical protein
MTSSFLDVDSPKLGSPVVKVLILTRFIAKFIAVRADGTTETRSRATWRCGCFGGSDVLPLVISRQGEFADSSDGWRNTYLFSVIHGSVLRHRE